MRRTAWLSCLRSSSTSLRVDRRWLNSRHTVLPAGSVGMVSVDAAFPWLNCEQGSREVRGPAPGSVSKEQDLIISMSSPRYDWDRQLQFVLMRTCLHTHSRSSKQDGCFIGTECAAKLAMGMRSASLLRPGGAPPQQMLTADYCTFHVSCPSQRYLGSPLRLSCLAKPLEMCWPSENHSECA